MTVLRLLLFFAIINQYAFSAFHFPMTVQKVEETQLKIFARYSYKLEATNNNYIRLILCYDSTSCADAYPLVFSKDEFQNQLQLAFGISPFKDQLTEEFLEALYEGLDLSTFFRQPAWPTDRVSKFSKELFNVLVGIDNEKSKKGGYLPTLSRALAITSRRVHGIGGSFALLTLFPENNYIASFERYTHKQSYNANDPKINRYRSLKYITPNFNDFIVKSLVQSYSCQALGPGWRRVEKEDIERHRADLSKHSSFLSIPLNRLPIPLNWNEPAISRRRYEVKSEKDRSYLFIAPDKGYWDRYQPLGKIYVQEELLSNESSENHYQSEKGLLNLCYRRDQDYLNPELEKEVLPSLDLTFYDKNNNEIKILEVLRRTTFNKWSYWSIKPLIASTFGSIIPKKSLAIKDVEDQRSKKHDLGVLLYPLKVVGYGEEFFGSVETSLSIGFPRPNCNYAMEKVLGATSFTKTETEFWTESGENCTELYSFKRSDGVGITAAHAIYRANGVKNRCITSKSIAEIHEEIWSQLEKIKNRDYDCWRKFAHKLKSFGLIEEVEN